MEEEEPPQGARSRSRSPRVSASKPCPETEGESKGWAAKWRQALSRTLGYGGKDDHDAKDTKDEKEGEKAIEEEPKVEADGESAKDADEKAEIKADAASEAVQAIEERVDEATGGDMQVEEIAYQFACIGCGQGFHEEAQLHDHWRASSVCCAEPLQAVVDHMACLPGARSTLWCPACPDDFVGRWTGPANKVGALLRHLAAAGCEDSPQAAAHQRLQAALVELLIAEPPEAADDLQEWAASCKLLAVAGPLLACPGAPAREAIKRLQDEMLGQDGEEVCKLSGVDGGEKKTLEDVEPDPNAEKTKLRILGLDLTIDDTSGTALYQDLPEDVGGLVDDGLGCSLPTGGITALTTFDLTLSSDEEVPVAGNKSTGEDDDETFV